MKRFPLIVVLAWLCLVGLPSAAAGADTLGAYPIAGSLTCPTHPDTETWTSGNDPFFQWQATGASGLYRPFPIAERVGVTVELAAQGRFAYLLDASRGLRILDCLDPAAPVLRAVYGGDFAGTGAAAKPLDLQVAGNYAYIATSRGLRLVSVAAPSSPKLVGTCAVTRGKLTVSGGWLFSNSPYKRSLAIIDARKKASPHLERYYAPGWSGPWSMAVAGDYLYLGNFNGLQVLRVKHTTVSGVQTLTVSRVSAIRLQGTGEIAVLDGYVYAAVRSLASKHLAIVDVRVPGRPRIVGRWEPSTQDWPGGTGGVEAATQDVAVAGSLATGVFAYLADADTGTPELAGGVRVLDVSSPTAPTLVMAENPEDGLCTHVAVANGTLFAAGRPRTPTVPGEITFDFGVRTYRPAPTAYSYQLAEGRPVTADTVPEMAGTPPPNQVTLNDVADGSWYFSLRARGDWGGWGPVLSTGPVRIDTNAPTVWLRSPTHPDPALPQPAPLTVTWSSTLELRQTCRWPVDAPALGLRPTDVSLVGSRLYAGVPSYGVRAYTAWEDGTIVPALNVRWLKASGSLAGIVACANPYTSADDAWLFLACGSAGTAWVEDLHLSLLRHGPYSAQRGARNLAAVRISGGWRYWVVSACGSGGLGLSIHYRSGGEALVAHSRFGLTWNHVPSGFVGAAVQDVAARRVIVDKVQRLRIYMATSRGLAIGQTGAGSLMLVTWLGGYRRGAATCIALSGDYAYLATTVGTTIKTREITVVRIADPSHASLKTTLALPSWITPRALAVKGRYLYITHDRGVAVVDIETYVDPKLSWMPGGWVTGSAARGLDTTATHAYLADYGDGSIRVLRTVPERFAYVLDHSPATVPATDGSSAQTTASSMTYEGLAPGVYWFHIRGCDEAGNWGATDHIEVNVQ